MDWKRILPEHELKSFTFNIYPFLHLSFVLKSLKIFVYIVLAMYLRFVICNCLTETGKPHNNGV